MVEILMISAKLVTKDLHFWSKSYDAKIFVHEVTNKILSFDSNYIVHMVMWPKFGNSVGFLWEKLL